MTSTDLKLCGGCGQVKPLAQFGVLGGKKPGRQPRCKTCAAAATRAWYARNSERARAYRRAKYLDLVEGERERARNRAWRAANPERVRDHNLRKKGLTLETYDAMLLAQGGACAACGGTDSGDRRFDTFAVDHDHETGRVRGLLCSGCNKSLGLLGDDPERLMALAAYLLQYTNLLTVGA